MRYGVEFGVMIWFSWVAVALSLALLAVPVVLVPVCLARMVRDWRGGFEVRVRRVWEWR